MIIEKLNLAVREYQKTWSTVTDRRQRKDFFAGLTPTAVGWKTTDLNEFDRLFGELRGLCDQIHLGWINQRWLATMHLKDTKLEGGIKVIKLMQRRPDSTDAVGLDHVDFLVPDLTETAKVLHHEQNLTWTRETSNPHCSWLSVWFSGTEAKLRSGTVLDVCIAEFQDVNQALLDRQEA